jgi:acyl-CoA thioesterase-2
MATELDRLVSELALERLEANLFRGAVTDTAVKRVYGGKVLGEAIKAAQMTVDDERTVHSIHAYFLREADSNNPIIYDVERSRDGRSFSARRVRAIQYGRPIFTMEASFHKDEQGIEYQIAMPEIPPPSGLTKISFDGKRVTQASPSIRRMRNILAPFEVRTFDAGSDALETGEKPVRRVWIKTNDRLPDDGDLHRAILAYVSDYGLLWTVIASRGYKIGNPNLMMASLDHAMWFHRPFRMDEWLLYACESVSAAGARGLARGSFYTEAGDLVCTVAQEGLIRIIDAD